MQCFLSDTLYDIFTYNLPLYIYVIIIIYAKKNVNIFCLICIYFLARFPQAIKQEGPWTLLFYFSIYILFTIRILYSSPQVFPGFAQTLIHTSTSHVHQAFFLYSRLQNHRQVPMPFQSDIRLYTYR